MSSAVLKVSFAAGFLLVSVALPFAVHFRLRGKTLDAEVVLRRQGDGLSQLAAENSRLSNAVAAANARSLSAEEFQELLRLRGEIARLREQTNQIGQWQSENQRLEAGSSAPPHPRPPMSESESSEALAAETLQAIKSIVAALPAAMQAFAAAHNGQQPKLLSDLRNFFPTSDGRRMTGLYAFHFVRDEGPQPGDTLILSEPGSRLLPDGKTRERIYAFSDGTIVPVRHPVEETDEGFKAWEKEHMKSPPPTQ
jgi:hypothetical protein